MILQAFQFQHSQESVNLRELHSEAEKLANMEGDDRAAREVYGAAIASYTALTPERQTSATDLAYARILRDDAFAAQRLLHRRGPQEAGFSPVNQLIESRKITAKLLGIETEAGVSDFGMSFTALKAITRNNEDLALLMAEHGATIAGIGRLTAQTVFGRSFSGLKANERKAARQMISANTWSFGRDQAHGFLVLGNNGYYRTSNALHGARVERALTGVVSKLKVAPWIRRAATGIGFTVVQDRPNLKPALKTTARLALDLPLRRTALRGIRKTF